MNLISWLKGFLNKKKPMDKNALKISKLFVSYGEKQVIKGIDIIIPKKQIIAIVGLSGSGKSTILKASMGLIKSKGCIYIKDKPNYCPQENAFFDELTVKENLDLFASIGSFLKRKDYFSSIKKYLVRLGLIEYLETPVKNLSGGQKKRLNIIISLLNKPKILVLDEPFAGLDFYNRKLLWNFFNELKAQGITIILTTHLLNEAEDYCNKIFIIKDGKIFSHGTVNHILKSKHIELVLNLKTNYLNKQKLEELKQFSQKNKLKLLDVGRTSLMFALTEENENSLINFLKKQGVKFQIKERRTPTLEDLFLTMGDSE